jgi:uncharacterized membrane protein
MWPLLGIAVLVLGFALRWNPVVVVITSAATTGLLAWHDPIHALAAFGKGFNDNRLVGAVWLVLPVIGLLERHGLQSRARALIGGVRQATVGRLLLVYLLYRQVTAALGLASAGGHAQMVRPLVAPMAEAALEKQVERPSDRLRAFVRAHASAVDNIGVFFGEDLFIAMSSIVLIKGFLDSSGISVQPLQLSVWAIPTAIAAFLIHGTRLLLLDRRIKRLGATPGPDA